MTHIVVFYYNNDSREDRAERTEALAYYEVKETE